MDSLPFWLSQPLADKLVLVSTRITHTRPAEALVTWNALADKLESTAFVAVGADVETRPSRNIQRTEIGWQLHVSK